MRQLELIAWIVKYEWPLHPEKEGDLETIHTFLGMLASVYLCTWLRKNGSHWGQTAPLMVGSGQ